MDSYAITDTRNDFTSGKYNNLDVAYFNAIKLARLRGFQVILLSVDEVTARLETKDGELLYTVQRSQARSVGRPLNHVEPIVVLPEFKFSGRPSSTGWFRDGVKRELTAETIAAQPWAARPKVGDYWCVWIRPDLSIAGQQRIDGVMATTTKRLDMLPKGKGRATGSVSMSDVACELSYNPKFTPPSDAVALFVVGRATTGWVVAGKRYV